jgi:hypothetical protein
VVHALGRRRIAEGPPEALVRDHGVKELPEVFVLEPAPGEQELLGEGPSILLRGREVVLLGDLLPPEYLELLHLHLERPAVLVGLSLDADVRRIGEPS